MTHGRDTSITLAEPPAEPVRDSSPALFSKVLDGDIPSLKSYENLLEVSVNATEPGVVLVEDYFLRTAAKDGKQLLEHVLKIGDHSPSHSARPDSLSWVGSSRRRESSWT
jgi:hypothetical protein